jgi:flagella basal body P-ring formation protein FlgA
MKNNILNSVPACAFIILIFIANIQYAMADTSATATGKVMESIKMALAEKGISGKLKIGINGYEGGFRLRDELSSYEIEAADITINEKTRFYRADIAITSADNKTKHYNVTGTYDEIVRVPVLAQKMPRGSVIKEADIAWLEVPHEQVKFEVVATEQKLIGKALKREIYDHTPLKEQDLQKEQVIARNTTVNILFNSPSINIKTIGITLDSGGVGDTIRVRNASSNKIIQGIIQDDQNVATLNLNNSLIDKTAMLEDKNYAK